jgi:hypothetical protein
MTQAAKRLGVSKMSVSKAVRDGRISRLDDGGIDLDTVEDEYIQNTHPGRSKAAQNGNGVAGRKRAATDHEGAATYANARTAKVALDARIRELDLKRMLGEVVSRDEVEQVAFAEARRARDLIMSLGPRLAPVVAGMTSPDECLRVIEHELRHVCSQLSGSVRKAT